MEIETQSRKRSQEFPINHGCASLFKDHKMPEVAQLERRSPCPVSVLGQGT
jgi:hypothetical protein